jgi:ZIP family zinc transporter
VIRGTVAPKPGIYPAGIDLLVLTLAAAGTALATGLGALPVYAMGRRAERLALPLDLVAAAVMTGAAVFGLLLPALRDGHAAEVWGGVVVGVAFLAVSRRLLGHHSPQVGSHSGPAMRRSALVFGVLLVHSLPEGMAMGTAWASDVAGLGLFVVLAMAIQNVPEGTATAVPMREAGFSAWQAFWAAVGTSVPQPIGAAGSYLLVETVKSLLPVSFGFAAGAMLALVVLELLPAIRRRALGSVG